MRILFIGTVEFSRLTLEKIFEMGGFVVGICTSTCQKLNADYADLSPFATKYKIPLIQVGDINSQESVAWISEKKPDVIFCFGWSRLLKNDVLRIAPMGVVGFHPAELPRNRGRHPIIWALVLGLKKTASTFFFMDSGADSGDILSQSLIEIDANDDAATLYNKIVTTALTQIEQFLPMLKSGEYKQIKQDHSLANYWRKRNRNDGMIDWRMTASSIDSLVRALSKPYVGAHFVLLENDIKVWKTEVQKFAGEDAEPGKIVSIEDGNYPVIKCGIDAIKIIHADPFFKVEIGKYL